MRNNTRGTPIQIRNTQARDFDSLINLTRQVYPTASPWSVEQLASHLSLFPKGQFVAVDSGGEVVGMASSLILRWDDYEFDGTWRDFTDGGMFTNHDPSQGHTLYGAEIMVDPERRSCGIGSRLYRARRVLAERLGLHRIRAGARLRGYWRFADRMSAGEYAAAVVRGDMRDPTLSFQLKHGFRVFGVVDGYLQHDPESLGYAALIEWLNPILAPWPEALHDVPLVSAAA